MADKLNLTVRNPLTGTEGSASEGITWLAGARGSARPEMQKTLFE